MQLSPVSQLLMRLPPLVGLLLFLVPALQQFFINPNWVLGMQVIAETITIVIYLTARLSKESAIGPIELISTLVGTFYFLAVNVTPGPALVPIFVATSLQGIGVGLQIWAKVTLGRSFGLLPANKGIVVRGPYRLVRHPIYLGYFITHVGFLLGYWHLSNALLLLVLYFFQIVRIFREEALLKQDETYLKYCTSTKYRFIPGLL